MIQAELSIFKINISSCSYSEGLVLMLSDQNSPQFGSFVISSVKPFFSFSIFPMLIYWSYDNLWFTYLSKDYKTDRPKHLNHQDLKGSVDLGRYLELLMLLTHLFFLLSIYYLLNCRLLSVRYRLSIPE